MDGIRYTCIYENSGRYPSMALKAESLVSYYVIPSDLITSLCFATYSCRYNA